MRKRTKTGDNIDLGGLTAGPVIKQRAHQFTDAECARFLAWFGAATTVPPGDFELAARIRRALS